MLIHHHAGHHCLLLIVSQIGTYDASSLENRSFYPHFENDRRIDSVRSIHKIVRSVEFSLHYANLIKIHPKPCWQQHSDNHCPNSPIVLVTAEFISALACKRSVLLLLYREEHFTSKLLTIL